MNWKEGHIEEDIDILIDYPDDTDVRLIFISSQYGIEPLISHRT